MRTGTPVVMSEGMLMSKSLGSASTPSPGELALETALGDDGLAVQLVGGVEGQGDWYHVDLNGLLQECWQAQPLVVCENQGSDCPQDHEYVSLQQLSGRNS